MMKARSGRIIPRDVDIGPEKRDVGYGLKEREPVDFPQREEEKLKEVKDSSSLSDESLVMVMMPKVSWMAFEKLAKRYGGSTAQAVSAALKLLEQKLGEVDGV